MENLLQNFASGLWIVLGVYCFFGLRKWNKRFSELYDELIDKAKRYAAYSEGDFYSMNIARRESAKKAIRKRDGR